MAAPSHRRTVAPAYRPADVPLYCRAECSRSRRSNAAGGDRYRRCGPGGTHAGKCARISRTPVSARLRIRRRMEILQHAPGLAASPGVRYKLRKAGNFRPGIVCCIPSISDGRRPLRMDGVLARRGRTDRGGAAAAPVVSPGERPPPSRTSRIPTAPWAPCARWACRGRSAMDLRGYAGGNTCAAERWELCGPAPWARAPPAWPGRFAVADGPWSRQPYASRRESPRYSVGCRWRGRTGASRTRANESRSLPGRPAGVVRVAGSRPRGTGGNGSACCSRLPCHAGDRDRARP